MKTTGCIKTCIAALLLCFAANAGAAKVSGHMVADKVRVDQQELVLNGAGMRTKFFFKIYIGALYLRAPLHSAEAVLADKGSKRIELYVLRHVSAADFMDAFNKAINKNHTSAEYLPISGRLIRFGRIFREVGEVNKGDVIQIDYLNSTDETALTIDGKERMRIVGNDFYNALLKIWLGKRPAQESLKAAMLGE